MEIFLPAAAGFIVGGLIGLTGMGGGAVMTPFLLLVLHMNPVLAVGTDLMFATITKLFGGIQHRREKNVSLRHVAWMACGSLPAAFLSARYVLSRAEDARWAVETLPVILGVVLILVGLIIFGRGLQLFGRVRPHKARLPAPGVLMIIGAIGGTLVGFTSVGGGTVIMALMILFFTFPFPQMVGLDVVHGALLAGVTAVTYAYSGQTDWRVVGLLLIGSLPGVWLGAHAVSRINPRIVRLALAVLILAAGIELARG